MRLVIVILAAALAACGPGIAVVPQGGLPQAIATSGPVTLTAFNAEWTGSPDDLTDYLTPVAVEVYNAGPNEVRVSYADFALRDPRGFRYAAINPFLPAQYGTVENHDQVLLAARGGGGIHVGAPSGTRGGFGHSRGHVWVGPPSGRRVGPGGVGIHGGWSGYRIHGGARGWYGPGWSYWGGPFMEPPWYSSWVFWWGPGYYPSDRPSADVIASALPEGVLEPGGRANGFLYFQKATDRSDHLDLAWEAHDARTGNFVGTAHLPLQVVER